MIRAVVPVVMAVVLVGCGSNPSSVLSPEYGKLEVSGYASGSKFHTEVEIDGDENAGLYTVVLMDKSGKEIKPDKWSDETPRPWKPSLGVGMGVGIPIGSNVGVGVGTGVSIPIGKKRIPRRTAVKAQWTITNPKRKIGQYRMRITVAVKQMAGADLKRTILNIRPPRGDTSARRKVWCKFTLAKDQPKTERVKAASRE